MLTINTIAGNWDKNAENVSKEDLFIYEFKDIAGNSNLGNNYEIPSNTRWRIYSGRQKISKIFSLVKKM